MLKFLVFVIGIVIGFFILIIFILLWLDLMSSFVIFVNMIGNFLIFVIDNYVVIFIVSVINLLFLLVMLVFILFFGKFFKSV